MPLSHPQRRRAIIGHAQRGLWCFVHCAGQPQAPLAATFRLRLVLRLRSGAPLFAWSSSAWSLLRGIHRVGGDRFFGAAGSFGSQVPAGQSCSLVS